MGFKHIIKKIFSNNLIFYILVILIFMGLLDYLIRGYDVIREEYGVDVLLFVYIFIASEAVFDLGIYLMLKGVGILNVKFKDFFKFKFSNIKIKTRLTFWGFLLNRIAAVIPWIYLLIVGINKLPLIVVLAIFLEIIIVLYIGSKVNIKLSLNQTMKKIRIRKATSYDAVELNNLDHRVWPEGSQSTVEMWQSRIETFSEGVIIAYNDKKLVGVLVVELIEKYDYEKASSWYVISDNGLIRKTHNNQGNILYGVALSVDPEFENQGVGTKLGKTALKLVLKRNIKYILLGARLINFSKYSSSMTPEMYVKKAFSGSDPSFDPELTFYKKLGFLPVQVIPNYFIDYASQNYGLLIRRKNPFFNNFLRYFVLFFL